MLFERGPNINIESSKYLWLPFGFQPEIRHFSFPLSVDLTLTENAQPQVIIDKILPIRVQNHQKFINVHLEMDIDANKKVLYLEEALINMLY